MRDRISYLFATGAYIGTIPGAPGTYASLATTVAYYLIYRIYFRILPELHLRRPLLDHGYGSFRGRTRQPQPWARGSKGRGDR